ncbi:BopA protein [Achromobacter arsenitoxydans SY8]|uniref:BopA protein n=1 Tax=Achromobacter arsenitoxydans SY8 TaxID=477184 RepID=H0F812_9BURK|nr:BopA protein [Achromobacter arsenitoxydans SY8]
MRLDDSGSAAQGRGVVGRLKDWIVSLPGGQGAESVKQDNMKATAVFAQALAGEYGFKAAAAAVDRVIGRNFDAALDKAKIDKMVSVAQGLSGLGAARSLARNVCLNSWARESSGLNIQRSGHSAVAISNGLSANTWSHEKQYVSWWPSTNDSVQVDRNRLLEKLPVVGDYFHARPAMSAPDYDSDRGDEISEKTNINLQRGEAAREVLRSAARLASEGRADPLADALKKHADDLKGLEFGDNPTRKDLESAAKFFARDSQELVSDRQWGAAAEKVFFPLAGRNGEHTAQGLIPQTTLFGLVEHDMLADARQLKDDAAHGRIGYSMFSTTQNCAAIAARSLQAGGSNIYVPFEASWITEDPNKTYDYARQLQGAIDGLNGKADGIKKFCDTAWQSAPADADAIRQLRDALHETANDQAIFAQAKQLALGIAADQRIDSLRAEVADRSGKMDQARSLLQPLDRQIRATEKDVGDRQKAVDNKQKAVDGMSRSAKSSSPHAAARLADSKAELAERQDELKKGQAELNDLRGQRSRLDTRILAMKDERRALKDLIEERQANPLEAARRKLGGEDDYYAKLRGGLAEGVTGLAHAFGARASGLDTQQQRLLAPLGQAVQDLERGVRNGSDMKTLLSHAKQLVQTLHDAINGTPAPDRVAALAAGALVQACEFLVVNDQDRHS